MPVVGDIYTYVDSYGYQIPLLYSDKGWERYGMSMNEQYSADQEEQESEEMTLSATFLQDIKNATDGRSFKVERSFQGMQLSVNEAGGFARKCKGTINRDQEFFLKEVFHIGKTTWFHLEPVDTRNYDEVRIKETEASHYLPSIVKTIEEKLGDTFASLKKKEHLRNRNEEKKAEKNAVEELKRKLLDRYADNSEWGLF